MFRIRGGLFLVGTRTYTIQGGLRGTEQESHSSSQRFGQRTPLYLSLTSVLLCIGVGRSVEADLDGAVADLVLVHDGHGALGVPLVDEADEAGAPLLHLGVLDLPAVAAN